MKKDSLLVLVCVVAGIAITGWVVFQAGALLKPVVAAMLAGYIVFPIVRHANRLGIPKSVSIIAMFIFMFALVVYLAVSLIPAVKNELEAVSNPDNAIKVAKSKLISISKAITQELVELGIVKEMAADQIIESISAFILEAAKDTIMQSSKFAKVTALYLLIFFFVLFFCLSDGDRIYHYFMEVMPNAFYENGVFIFGRAAEIFGGYLRGLVIETVILTFISFSLLLVLGEFTSLTVVLAGAIAVILGVTNVIRIVGPIIGTVIGIILLLTVGDTVDAMAIAGVIGVTIIIQILDNAVILPSVMKDQVDIHPVICLVGILAGGEVAGILGMILAIPVIGGAKVVYQVLSVELKRFGSDSATQIVAGG